MHDAWTVKHKPKSLAEIVGNTEAIHTLVDWIRSWEEGVPKKRAAFLYGPPGVGKTLTVETIANEFEMEFVEKNASDYRTADAINRFGGLASQYTSLFGRKRIILFDELNGLTGTSDRGGVKAITDVVKIARCPIVLIGNNAYNPRFATLRKYCLLIEFKKPHASKIAKHLKRICALEDIETEEAVLKFIAQRSDGDIRSAVMDIQALGQGKGRLTYDDVSWIGHRNRQDSIFSVLKMIFFGKTCMSAKRAVDVADVDIDMLFEWIYENVPAHFTDPHDLADAMNALAIADVYRGRIRRTRNWGFMRYLIDYMTAGVAMARQKTKVSGWTPFKFPTRIQMLSRSRAERGMQRSIAAKIARKSHISIARAPKEIIPFLKIIFRNDPEMAAGITKWLDLNQEMVDYLVGNGQKSKVVIGKTS